MTRQEIAQRIAQALTHRESRYGTERQYDTRVWHGDKQSRIYVALNGREIGHIAILESGKVLINITRGRADVERLVRAAL